MRWRKRRQPPRPAPRPRSRRDLADADAGASATPDVPPVPAEVRVHREEEPTGSGVPGAPDQDAPTPDHATGGEELFGAARPPAAVPPSPAPDAGPAPESDGADDEAGTEAAAAPSAAPEPAAPPARDRSRSDHEPPRDAPPSHHEPPRDAPPSPHEAAVGAAPAPRAEPTVAGRRSGSHGTAPAPQPGDVVLDPGQVAAAGRAVVRRALDEDLDAGGDVTSLATVAPDAVGRAAIVARADGVVAGVDLVAVVYDQLDPRVRVEAQVRDGDRIRRGQALLRVTGPLRSVLTGERTALNLLTHLSGVATRTARYVDAVDGTGCVIRDTRKTTPGLRLLEKAAVVAGGGVNHRVGLSDALLVKDNHAAAAGGVAAATAAALAGAEGRHVQIEVDSLAELEEALDAGARDVLLDNFDVEATRRAVARVREREPHDGRILLETSGGVTLETVRDYAETGVDRVAIGALTHSAPQLDIALDVATDRRPADVRFAPGPVAGDRGEDRIFPDAGG